MRSLLEETAETAAELTHTLVTEGGASGEAKPDGMVLHFAFVMMLLLLMLAYMAAYFLHRKHIHWIPEAGASLLIGIIVGLIISKVDPHGELEGIVKFDKEIFFLIFLPPIIFESGYNMKRVVFETCFFKKIHFFLLDVAAKIFRQHVPK